MFITIDGPDGCGKTTACKNIVNILNNRYNIKSIYTNEPYQLPKDIFNKDSGYKKEEVYDLLLKDREVHIEEFIIPIMLDDECIVICDRYKYSMTAYQSLQGFDIDKIIEAHEDMLIPNLTIIFQLDIDKLIKRINYRNKKLGLENSIFENRNWLENIIKIYNNMHNYYPLDDIIHFDCKNRTKEQNVEILTMIILPEIFENLPELSKNQLLDQAGTFNLGE